MIYSGLNYCMLEQLTLHMIKRYCHMLMYCNYIIILFEFIRYIKQIFLKA